MKKVRAESATPAQLGLIVHYSFYVMKWNLLLFSFCPGNQLTEKKINDLKQNIFSCTSFFNYNFDKEKVNMFRMVFRVLLLLDNDKWQ